MRWPPRNNAKKEARVDRGMYLCNLCQKEVPVTVKLKDKRVNNVTVDHIDPVVNPKTGFNTWEEYVTRLFVEEEALQVLCKKCHDTKTKEERESKKK
jgi:hypothetical protein